MKTFFKNNWLYFIGALFGALGGYVYWAEVGCLSGTCPITSSPYLSILWGTAMGALLFGLFQKKKVNEKE